MPSSNRVVWPSDCYHGVAGLIDAGVRSGRWAATRLAADDTDAWYAAAGSCDLLWIESPSNPLLVVADVPRIAAAPRRSGAMLVVDNTLAGPLVQRPLDVGADISIQSATKQLGGHSDLLCGVACTRDPELVARLRRQRELHGAIPGALETFLAIRGIRTLGVRHAAAQASAGVIAERLERHRSVDVVRYPGLASDPGHDLAVAQFDGFGTVLSFDVVGGASPADDVCTRVRTICHATSFGAVESTIERRAGIPGQEHLPPGLLRLSVGIEHVDDIWADLEQALDGPSDQRR
jgi:cystathionine gamma-synthase